jgi:hypothetical protein
MRRRIKFYPSSILSKTEEIKLIRKSIKNVKYLDRLFIKFLYGYKVKLSKRLKKDFFD